jgi:hypothetical protein
MTRAFSLGASIIVMVLSTYPVAVAQTTLDTTEVKDSQNTNFLAGISGIQGWAVKLEATLRNQGDKINQRKAKEKLLPQVIEIQKGLSDLEGSNRKVAWALDAYKKNQDRLVLADDLYSLAMEIYQIEGSFQKLREGVQVVSLPDMTEVERLGEAAVIEKGNEIADSLEALGYSHGVDQNYNPKIDYAAVKARSEEAATLLHQAQDAFGKLHTYLSN